MHARCAVDGRSADDTRQEQRRSAPPRVRTRTGKKSSESDLRSDELSRFLRGRVLYRPLPSPPRPPRHSHSTAPSRPETNRDAPRQARRAHHPTPHLSPHQRSAPALRAAEASFLQGSCGLRCMREGWWESSSICAVDAANLAACLSPRQRSPATRATRATGRRAACAGRRGHGILVSSNGRAAHARTHTSFWDPVGSYIHATPPPRDPESQPRAFFQSSMHVDACHNK